MGEPVAKVVQREERRDIVMELALAGATTREIARQVGVHHSTVATDIKARLESSSTDENTSRYRELQRQRIARLLHEWWTCAKVDLEALDRVLRLLDREAKLLGLDKPVRQSIDMRHEGGIMIAPARISPEDWVKEQTEKNAKRISPTEPKTRSKLA